MTFAFTFPGQGSQVVGMGQALALEYSVAKAVFDEVDDALDEKLSNIIWNGTQEELTLTKNAQPALMAVSLATFRILEHEGVKLSGNIAYVAGHSLGEYSALAAAGVLEVSDTARLLRLRGNAMQAAVAVGEGAMAAVLGLTLDEVRAVAAEAAQGEVCEAANDNAPGQVVISGQKSAVERAAILAKEKGAKRAILLPVSAPFHCRLMQPAAEKMAEALAGISFEVPTVPVVVNVKATAISEPNVLRSSLVEQVTGMVRWSESVAYMAGQGVDCLFELGSGKVLSGLARRIVKGIETVPVGTPDDIKTVLARLS
ncbi:MAG: [acyl-carrier-protein] S-malonyltransferase [Hyphomicrobiales bacterium]|nr:MAG: [acyl-carrier-protein] S-malonyltransferase [Hyphomicrobiales bacterium]PCH81730.1 MAG: [acyl-carrier-protein] S-malonyltransferase [Hyphomicrobiales bacterium]